MGWDRDRIAQKAASLVESGQVLLDGIDLLSLSDEEMRQKREQIRAELEALPPGEREARMEQLRAQYKKNREEHREEFHREFQQRWEDASPEKRAIFCDQAQERCDEGGVKACDFVGDACDEIVLTDDGHSANSQVLRRVALKGFRQA